MSLNERFSTFTRIAVPSFLGSFVSEAFFEVCFELIKSTNSSQDGRAREGGNLQKQIMDEMKKKGIKASSDQRLKKRNFIKELQNGK